MKDSIEKLIVSSCNNNVSFQDLGRKSQQNVGFSVGGAADEHAYCLANALVANQIGETALEITMGNCSFAALDDCEIAITGADCNVHVDQSPISHNQIFHLKKGQKLTFEQPKLGIHSYLSVRGGWYTKSWQESSSQVTRELSFHLCAQKIKNETILSSGNGEPKSRTALLPLSPLEIMPMTETMAVRFIPSSRYVALPIMEQLTIEKTCFTISPNSNRMGYRLLSEKKIALKKDKLERKLSVPVAAGIIQISNDGQPIILMKDSQTIGGYPVLGSVMKTDLFKLAQLRPGQQLSFVPCSVQFATNQLKMFYAKF